MYEQQNKQLSTEIKDLQKEIRNRDKHLQKETKELKLQFEEQKQELIRTHKAEMEALIQTKDKEMQIVQDSFEKMKASLEKHHQHQIKELKSEAVVRTKILNKKLRDLKLEIDKQQKVSKADSIRMVSGIYTPNSQVSKKRSKRQKCPWLNIPMVNLLMRNRTMMSNHPLSKYSLTHIVIMISLRATVFKIVKKRW